MKIRSSILLSISLIFLISCNTESASSFKFRFRVSDTVAGFKFFLYTRVVADFKEESIPLEMIVLSPEGKRYLDTLYFPILNTSKYGVVDVVKSGIWKDVRWLYRDGVTFPKKGLWLFTVKQISPLDNKLNIKEMGIMIKAK